MKVAFDSQVFAAQQYGGISRSFAQLAANLVETDIAPRIVAPLYVNAYLDALPEGVVDGRRVAFGRWQGRLARGVDALLTERRIDRWGARVVHETWYPRRPTKRRMPMVTTVHDMIHERFPDLITPGDPTAGRKAAAVARAAHIVCVSDQTRRDLIEAHPGAAGRISVIHHGFSAGPPPSPERLHAAPYLLCVGPRGGYKNWSTLVEVLTAVDPNLDLVAVGGGGFTPAETAQLAACGVAARVLHASADDRALATWYAHAAAFVYPSLYEGFGIPPLEAMSAGTPVVAVRAGAVPEVCGDAASYAEPGDASSLLAAIVAALDTDRRATLIAAGRQRVSSFSWDRCAAAHADVYRRLG